MRVSSKEPRAAGSICCVWLSSTPFGFHCFFYPGGVDSYSIFAATVFSGHRPEEAHLPWNIEQILASTKHTKRFSKLPSDSGAEPWNIPRNIGCALGPQVAAKTWEHFSELFYNIQAISNALFLAILAVFSGPIWRPQFSSVTPSVSWYRYPKWWDQTKLSITHTNTPP